MRKPDFCICENIDADQLHGNNNHAADQRLCFLYIVQFLFLNRKFQASSHVLWPYSSVSNHTARFQTGSETPKTGFLTTQLISLQSPFLPILQRFQHYLKDKGPEHLLLFDLIEKMLDYNPSTRVTLFDACRHQFFQSIHIKEPKERRPGFPLSYPDMPGMANGNGSQELRQHGSRETDPIVIDESSCESESKFEHIQPRDREVDRDAFKR